MFANRRFCENEPRLWEDFDLLLGPSDERVTAYAVPTKRDPQPAASHVPIRIPLPLPTAVCLTGFITMVIFWCMQWWRVIPAAPIPTISRQTGPAFTSTRESRRVRVAIRRPRATDPVTAIIKFVNDADFNNLRDTRDQTIAQLGFVPHENHPVWELNGTSRCRRPYKQAVTQVDSVRER